jgi:hypothetical protein
MASVIGSIGVYKLAKSDDYVNNKLMQCIAIGVPLLSGIVHVMTQQKKNYSHFMLDGVVALAGCGSVYFSPRLLSCVLIFYGVYQGYQGLSAKKSYVEAQKDFDAWWGCEVCFPPGQSGVMGSSHFLLPENNHGNGCNHDFLQKNFPTLASGWDTYYSRRKPNAGGVFYSKKQYFLAYASNTIVHNISDTDIKQFTFAKLLEYATFYEAKMPVFS